SLPKHHSKRTYMSYIVVWSRKVREIIVCAQSSAQHRRLQTSFVLTAKRPGLPIVHAVGLRRYIVLDLLEFGLWYYRRPWRMARSPGHRRRDWESLMVRNKLREIPSK